MTIKFSLQSSISGTSVIVALVIHLPDVILDRLESLDWKNRLAWLTSGDLQTAFIARERRIVMIDHARSSIALAWHARLTP